MSKFTNRPNSQFAKPVAVKPKPPFGNNPSTQTRVLKPIFSKTPRAYSATEMADRGPKVCVCFVMNRSLLGIN